MPTPHIEIIEKLEGDIAANDDVSLTAQELDTLSKNINEMMANGTPDEQAAMRKRLGALQESLRKHVSERTIRAETATQLRGLQNALVRSNVGAYNPETGGLETARVIKTAMDRYSVEEQTYLPGIANASPNLRTTARVVMGVTALAAVGTALTGGVLLLRRAFRSFGNAVTHPIATASAIGASILSLGASFAIIRNLPLPEGIRARLPSWLTALSQQPVAKQTAEQIKKLQEDRQAAEKTTITALTEADDHIRNPNLGETARRAITAIDAELRLIAQIPGTELNARRDELLQSRSRMQLVLSPKEVKELEEGRQKEIQYPPNIQNFIKRNGELSAAAQKAFEAFQATSTPQTYETAFFANNEQRGHLRNIQQVLTGVPQNVIAGAQAIADTGMQAVAARETQLERLAVGGPAAERSLQLRNAVQGAQKVINAQQENTDINQIRIDNINVERRVEGPLSRGFLYLDNNLIEVTGDGMTVSINNIQKRGENLFCSATVFGINADFTLSAHDVVRLMQMYRTAQAAPPTSAPGRFLTGHRQVDNRILSVNGTNRTINTRIIIPRT